jgi:hypothetical protein
VACERDGEAEQEVEVEFTNTCAMRRAGILALAAGALLAAACGSSSSGSTEPAAPAASTPSAPATTQAAATTVAASPSTTPTGPASTTPTGPPPCRAASLSLSFLGGQGATGHGELGFALRNTGNVACSTIGYPGVQFLDQDGRALPTAPDHTTQDFFGSVPKLPLTIAPGSIASFRLGVTHGAASPVGCTTAYGLQVIPPNDTATLRITIPNGAYECRTATVSPLAAGSAAYS